MKQLALTLAIASIGFSCISQAKDRYYQEFYNNDGMSSEEYLDFARVVDSQPIYETVSYQEPIQKCHYETRMVRYGGNDSKTAIIVGSLIGGAIGNKLGHKKSNQRVGAVAGAILGGSIASDLQGKNKHYHGKRERVCMTTEKIRYKQELSGYNVTYKYRGRTYSTVMDQQPGDRIRIAVSLRPLGSAG